MKRGKKANRTQTENSSRERESVDERVDNGVNPFMEEDQKKKKDVKQRQEEEVEARRAGTKVSSGNGHYTSF